MILYILDSSDIYFTTIAMKISSIQAFEYAILRVYKSRWWGRGVGLGGLCYEWLGGGWGSGNVMDGSTYLGMCVWQPRHSIGGKLK